MAMLQAIANDTMSDVPASATPEVMYAGDYAELNPILIYEEHDKPVISLVEGVVTRKGEPMIKVRKHGFRKDGYSYTAGSCVGEREVVPVLCFVDAELVDKMLISPAALAMGMFGTGLLTTEDAPSINPLVDLLVEEYEESISVEREFFSESEFLEVSDALTWGADLTADLTDADVEPVSTFPVYSRTAIAEEVPLVDYTLDDQGYVTFPNSTAESYDLGDVDMGEDLLTSEQHDLFNTASGIAPSDEPLVGLLEDGEVVPFDPQVHVV
jgi:hypothetical protein